MMILSDIVYSPFLDPLPIWNNAWWWPILLIPLCAAVAVVYKSIRCRRMSEVPREALVLMIFIVLGMVLTAGALAGVALLME
jgi:hypothetical protein